MWSTSHKASMCLAVLVLLCVACESKPAAPEYPGVTRVSSPGGPVLSEPVWSPDGYSLAVTSQASGESGPEAEVYILEGTSGELDLLLETDYGLRWMQSWSPDGEEVAFSASIDIEGIWAMSADGDGEPYFVGDGVAADWSPVGDQMAICDNRSIWILDLETGEKQLAFGGSGEYASGWGLSWSPDGARLAFTSATGQEEESDYGDIYILDLATGDRHQLTHNGNSSYPAWSPDGRLLAYVGETSEHEYTIFITRVDGACSVQPLGFNGYIFGLDWSPDGSQIAFEWEGNIYVVDVAAVLGEDFLTTGPVCP